MITQSLGVVALLVYTLWPLPLLLSSALYLFYAAILFALISLVVYRAV